MTEYRRVLVTGGSGFVGKRTIPLLLARGLEVVAIARSAKATTTLELLGAAVIAADLDDAESLDHAFELSQADVLVNIASLGFGHANSIVAAAAEAGIQRAVFVSTTAIFTNLNAGSKAVRTEAEQIITTSGLDWTIVRPTMIYGGPDDRNIARLLRLLKRTPVAPLPGAGERLQQPIHVEDLAQVIVEAALNPVAIGKAYDVAGPQPLAFRQLIEQAGAAVGRRPRLVRVPLTPAIAAVRLYERIAKRPRLKAEQLERLAEDKAFDITSARTDLAFRPRTFADGVSAEAGLLGSR